MKLPVKHQALVNPTYCRYGWYLPETFFKVSSSKSNNLVDPFVFNQNNFHNTQKGLQWFTLLVTGPASFWGGVWETEVFNLDLRLFSVWTKITDMPKMVGFFMADESHGEKIRQTSPKATVDASEIPFPTTCWMYSSPYR